MWKAFVTVLGISAAIALLVPSLVVVAAFTIVGIPIALYLIAAPLLFLFAGGTTLVARLLGGGMRAAIAGAIVTLVVLAVPPFLINLSLESRARGFVADDHNDEIGPIGRILAIRLDVVPRHGGEALGCDDICQRALLNGEVDRFLVAEHDVTLPIDPDLEARSYRLERRETCPAVKLPRGANSLPFEDEHRGGKPKRVDELLQLEIAKGNCLIADVTTLGTADAIVSAGWVNRGKSPFSAGLSITADTINAYRTLVHVRREESFVEMVRSTAVTAHKLAPLYVPTILGGSELRTYAALLRVEDQTLSAGKPTWSQLIVDRLGFDLAIRQGGAENDIRTILIKALGDTSDGQVPAAVVESFYDGVRVSKKVEGDDLDLARRLLTDERFPVPSQAVSAVAFAKDAPADYFQSIGTAMFTRLRGFAKSDSNAKRQPRFEGATGISRVISHLPRETILRHRDDLEWLARQDRLRVPTYGALVRLSEFGTDGAKTLLWLIDDSHRFRGGGEVWQHPHLAGLLGLCRIGRAAGDFVMPVLQRLDAGVIANRGSYHRLVIHTLVGMGATPDQIWLHAGELEGEPREARFRFDRVVQQAQRKVRCYF